MKVNEQSYLGHLKFAKQAAISAGKILLRYEKKIESLSVSYKDAEGLASTADVASEQFIIKEIQKKYPGHFILGEESSFEQAGTNKIELFERCKKEPFSWIIDPLDGTNNYLNRLPFYAVCIALAVKGNPVMGVVYVPSTGEMYEAVKGGGAFFRKAPGERRQRMTCKGFKKDLGQCILATGFSSEKGKVFDKEFTIFKKMLENTRGIRRFGSAALDMCWSARGIIDGFWEKGLAPWDMAAPGIICKEAGLVLSDFSGGKFDPFVPNVIAAPRRIQTKLTKILG